MPVADGRPTRGISLKMGRVNCILDGNIMKDGSDRIILIDFGFAGRAGSAGPTFIPSWVYAGGIFEVENDLKTFERFIR